MSLKIEQKQSLLVTSQLIQSLDILQMTNQELTVYLAHIAEENPVIDIDALHGEDSSIPLNKLISSDFRPDYLENDRNTETNSDYTAYAASTPGETLEEHLLSQLAAIRLEEKERQICQYLIRCMDESGYLDEDAAGLAQLFSVEEQQIDRCLSVLRSMHPPGVCAKDLKSCLLSQLPGEASSVPARIIRSHLDALALGHYPSIARALSISEAEVRKASELIGGLNPIPSAGFADNITPYFIQPDAEIMASQDKCTVVLSHAFFPSVQINPDYEELFHCTEDASLRAYLQEKLESAGNLRRAVEQRKVTFVRCLQAIVDRQKDYFLHGGDFVPMTLTDIAEQVGVQPSTVSRAIRGKYLQCPKGLCQIKDLFSSGAEGAGGKPVAYASVRDRVRAMIAQENKASPLSDQAICEKLRDQGIDVSRRVVAKYRSELGIPSTFIRKQAN